MGSTEERVVLLYWPVGPQELELIQASGYTRFPPRPHHQMLFSPLLEEAAALRIAHEWALHERAVACVLRFAVNVSYLERYPLPEGERAYCIPAEDLPVLNANIVGRIEVVQRCRPPRAGTSRG